MADVSKIFKPRRGTASIMAGTKKSTVLASGELFVEVPNTGVGTGASKIKIGDGTTAYSSLPYALGDTSNDKINFSSNTSTTVTAALNSVVTGASLKNIVAGLKQAISLCNTSITQLNDDFVEQLKGAGMTVEQSNQLQELYDKLINVDDGKRNIILLGSANGTNYSISLSHYEGYQDFTEDNFLIEIISCGIGGWVNAAGNPSISCTVTKTYNKTTGDLSITKISGVWNNYNSNGLNHGNISLSVKYNVYLIY